MLISKPQRYCNLHAHCHRTLYGIKSTMHFFQSYFMNNPSFLPFSSPCHNSFLLSRSVRCAYDDYTKDIFETAKPIHNDIWSSPVRQPRYTCQYSFGALFVGDLVLLEKDQRVLADMIFVARFRLSFGQTNWMERRIGK